ncbi:MAG: malectin [Bryobacteraceae bacterium]|nr:malectin [Bryobacteraceae bacterium]
MTARAARAGYRVFDVYVNGVAVLWNFDLVRGARGPGRPLRKTFSGLQTDANDAVRLQFAPVRNCPRVNAFGLAAEGLA